MQVHKSVWGINVQPDSPASTRQTSLLTALGLLSRCFKSRAIVLRLIFHSICVDYITIYDVRFSAYRELCAYIYDWMCIISSVCVCHTSVCTHVNNWCIYLMFQDIIYSYLFMHKLVSTSPAAMYNSTSPVCSYFFCHGCWKYPHRPKLIITGHSVL